MRKLTGFTIVALGLALSLSSVASAGRSTGSIFLRGGVEYTGHSLDDLKDYQDYNNELLAGLDMNMSPPLKNVGAALGFDLELGYQVSPVISVGIGFARARHSRENSSTGEFDIYDQYGYVATEELTLDQELGASISEITGNVTFWVPGAAGLFVGVQGGLGMRKYAETVTFTVAVPNYDVSETLTTSADDSGNGFVCGAFAGYDLAFSNGVSVFAKAGYRLRNLGKLKDTEVVRDFMGYPESVELNFSGMFASAGLGFSFGGAAR